MLYLAQIKSYRHYKERWITFDTDNFLSARDIEIAPSENET